MLCLKSGNILFIRNFGDLSKVNIFYKPRYCEKVKQRKKLESFVFIYMHYIVSLLKYIDNILAKITESKRIKVVTVITNSRIGQIKKI